MHPFSAYYFSAEVAKSVDAVDSKSTAARRAGSIPAFGTIEYEQSNHREVVFLFLGVGDYPRINFIPGYLMPTYIYPLQVLK